MERSATEKVWCLITYADGKKEGANNGNRQAFFRCELASFGLSHLWDGDFPIVDTEADILCARK